MKKLALAALIAATASALAQDAPPLKVLYQPAHGRNARLLDAVMDILLARPGFIKSAAADAQTLVVSVPQMDYHISSGDNVPFNFTLHFARDGNEIGEAKEECASKQPEACADLVASDLTAAAAIHR
jgi:hypothetical protein